MYFALRGAIEIAIKRRLDSIKRGSFMEGQKRVVLNDKREILLNDENDIVLSVVSNGETKYTFPVPYPSEGYGGGTLLLSLSEQYLIFTYYSGQSEEAFILFRIDSDVLKPIYESGYFYGEGASYIFSNSEKFLFQALRTGWWYEEEAETDKNGDPFYVFGEINVLDIMKKTLTKHSIHIYPSDSWKEEVTDEGSFQLTKIVNTNILHVMMPWGEETLALPLKDSIVFKPES